MTTATYSANDKKKMIEATKMLFSNFNTGEEIGKAVGSMACSQAVRLNEEGVESGLIENKHHGSVVCTSPMAIATHLEIVVQAAFELGQSQPIPTP